ncbi:MAG: DEAD/DEAH box helicase [Nitrospinae bacterium]|nr:DEAD/DEAH box helicase [Nitrospinota bacterium]
MKNFNELNLPKQLSAALAAMKYETPTPIQAKAIPAAMEGRDVMGCAQTGTGKTAAFSIPLITGLIANPQKTALILAPTRELAAQIADVLRQMTAKTPDIRSVLIIGGEAMGPQIRAVSRGVRIVVATPGRLVDHLQQGTISLKSVGYLVLDEADRMLDMGFAPQINKIVGTLPKERQTLLFSATLPQEITRLASKYMKQPVSVSAGENTRPAKAILQKMVETTHPKKGEILLSELTARQGSVLIFVRTKRGADRMAKMLFTRGFEATLIHGGRSQRQRFVALDGFRKGRYRILVATDVAARGLDVPHIAHVINYDLPQTAEDYVHRIGRTARAGAQGEALALVTPEDRGQWRMISRHVGNA